MDDKTITGDSNDSSEQTPDGTTRLPPGENGGSTLSTDSEQAAPYQYTGNDLSGTTLGGYRLVRRLAEGGMGVVYEAIQVKLDRKVALKVLTDQLSGREEFLKRFEREAKAAAALNHPNVVQVHDFGETGGRHYIIMEFVEGEDLSEYICRVGKLPVDEALNVIESAALALKVACEKSIIHRDIKPSNLMLTRDGHVKVSDLGLAKILSDKTEVTATGIGIGSPYFIAPEQADDASNVDHRVDIYSLGITLLFLLTGRKPFDGNTPFSIVLAHVSKPLPTGAELGTELAPEVEALIQRMAAKDPNDRYQDYDSLLADIQRVRAGIAPIAPPLTRSKAPWRSAKVLAGIAAGVVLIFGVVAFLATKSPDTSPAQPVPATPLANNPVDAQPLAELRNDFPPDEPQRFAEDQRRRQGPGARQGGLRERGPGGAGGRPMMPHGPPPPPNHEPLADGPVETMLAKADAMANQPDPVYVDIINAYVQVMEKARGTPLERQVTAKIEQWKLRHSAAARKEVTERTAAMKGKLATGLKADAVAVWFDFPAGLRSYETDRQIVDIVSEAIPDWQSFMPEPRP